MSRRDGGGVLGARATWLVVLQPFFRFFSCDEDGVSVGVVLLLLVSHGGGGVVFARLGGSCRRVLSTVDSSLTGEVLRRWGASRTPRR